MSVSAIGMLPGHARLLRNLSTLPNGSTYRGAALDGTPGVAGMPGVGGAAGTNGALGTPGAAGALGVAGMAGAAPSALVGGLRLSSNSATHVSVSGCAG